MAMPVAPAMVAYWRREKRRHGRGRVGPLRVTEGIRALWGWSELRTNGEGVRRAGADRARDARSGRKCRPAPVAPAGGMRLEIIGGTSKPRGSRWRRVARAGSTILRPIPNEP